MLKITEETPIFLYGGPIDLRNGFEGLAFTIYRSFGEPISGAYYVFINRRRTRAKVLHWTENQRSLWYTHTQRGVFSSRHLKQGVITSEEFELILQGKPPKYLICEKMPL